MASKITQEMRDKFISTKTKHDSMNKAIRLAKSNGVDEKGIQALISLKQELRDECERYSSKFLGCMNLSSNIVRIKDQWHGIRYLDDKSNIELIVEVLNDKDIPILKRDGRSERELSRTNINDLLPGCVDEVELEIYKQAVSIKAEEVLFDYVGVKVETEGVESGELTVSSHAGKRYVQRVLGIGSNNEDVAESYRRSNYSEVNKAILEGYSDSETLWTGEDDISYSFDSNNIMYVVGNNNIITLYEEDFGFSKDINRIITFEQVGVLRDTFNSLKEVELEHQESVDGITSELSDIVDEVEVLESKIEYLISRKTSLTAIRDQGAKNVKVVRNEFNKEFNKLFKKWDS